MVIGSLWGIIKLSDWWGKKGIKDEGSPEVTLVWNEGLTDRAGRRDVEILSMIMKNTGRVSAEGVEVRLFSVEQKGINFMKSGDRYILHQFNSVKAGDSIPCSFIHDMKGVNQLITPAGNDRVFDRADSVFTFHILGSNFEPVIQKMIMKLDVETNRFRILPL